jgi:hypothetical protein
MKTIRQLFAVTSLTLSVAAAALAGDMPTPGLTAPPPPANTPAPNQSKVVAGLPDDSSAAYDALTEAALLLCHKVLSLL